MLKLNNFIYQNVRKYLLVSQEKYLYYESIVLRIIGVNNQNKPTNLVPIGLAEEMPWREDANDIEPVDSHILWAAPKSRRSVEKRRTRRIGSFDYVCKLIPLRKLQTCFVCGHTYEIGKLCPNCYSKIKEVSDAIKEAMIKSDGKKPIENEYKPIFIGEKDNFQEKFYNGKQILEVPIERPSWFAKKLTQKSNVAISSGTSLNIPNPAHIKIKGDS